VTRPLLIIFLTIFVNLVGFGIIIPLLPFYAETFGASPIVIGLLFAVFSLCQLVAAPALGDLSDRYGRRPILIFSLVGTVISFVMLALAHSIAMLFVARIVDGLSGGNISTARAYVADVTEPNDRARAYGLIGAAFGLGFILGPALSGILSGISYTAPIWAAAALTVVATVMAWLWLPETVHRTHASAGSACSAR
jgi:DHA1 family tetracycline resistance protein-like MFS transporter